MPDPPVTETEIGTEVGPTGLVDPRAIHPGPDDAPPVPRPEAKSGAEGGSRTDAASPPDPEAPAVDVTQGSGLSDPRASLPGPHLGV